jgi:hypothetical protein
MMDDNASNGPVITWYQQGDVIIKPVTVIPDGANPVGGRVLAEGEATGHKHQAEAEDVLLFMHAGTLYMRVPSGTRIVHEEHKELDVPPGDYLVGKVREYDHFAETSKQPLVSLPINTVID